MGRNTVILFWGWRHVALLHDLTLTGHERGVFPEYALNTCVLSAHDIEAWAYQKGLKYWQ